MKRNTELQFEAMQAYKEYAGLSLGLGGGGDELAQLPNPEELEQLLDDKREEEQEQLEQHEYDPEKVGRSRAEQPLYSRTRGEEGGVFRVCSCCFDSSSFLSPPPQPCDQ